MTELEHYFENLLYDGHDVADDANKKCLTLEEQRAVEICADYILYTTFNGREDFYKFVNPDERYADWEETPQDDGFGLYFVEKCSRCGNLSARPRRYCPECGSKMSVGKRYGNKPIEYIPPYDPVCPLGYDDCVCDPAYVKYYYPDLYEQYFGDMTTEEAAQKNCVEYLEKHPNHNCYDNEDK